MTAITIAAILVGIALLTPVARAVDRGVYDLFVGRTPPQEPTIPVMLVTIDEASFRELDRRWPWPRTIVADALSTILSGNPAAVALDMLLSERGYTAENDAALAAVTASADSVIVAGKFVTERYGSYEVLSFEPPRDEFVGGAPRSSGIDATVDGNPENDREADHPRVGYVNLNPDGDGVVRSLQSVFVHAEVVHGSLTSVAVEAALASLKDDTAPPPESFLIHYARDREFPRVSFHALLSDDFDPTVFEGALVFVGPYFSESHDLHETPLSGEMYGVEIFAHAAATILADEYIRVVPPAVGVVAILILATVAGVAYTRFRPAAGLAVVALGSIAVAIASYCALNGGSMWIPPGATWAVLVVGFGAGLFNHYFGEARERARIRAVFSRYVAPAVVGEVLNRREALKLGGELRRVTIFFSDIRGFTPLTERQTPEETVAMLNEYFEAMAQVIFDYEGTINKYIGDAIMAVYGAPIAQSDASSRAVRACLAMRRRLHELNEQRTIRGDEPIRIGMGVHVGEVIVGNIGSLRQMEYTVIGDAVNVCSRIESQTKALGTDLLISDDVYHEVDGEVLVETCEPQRVKGKAEPIVLHKVFGLRGAGG